VSPTSKRSGTAATRAAKVLSGRDRIGIGVVALLLAAVVAYYLHSPPATSSTTTVRNAHHEVVSSTTEKQAQISDVILLGGFGFAVVLGLVAIFNDRLKLTGPGGVSVEAAAVAAAADAAFDPRGRELTKEQKEALERWSDVKGQIFGDGS
jgi:hypothetical protein